MKSPQLKIANKIMSAIWEDCHDRSGIQNAFEGCDSGIRKEIRQQWIALILKHLPEPPKEGE